MKATHGYPYIGAERRELQRRLPHHFDLHDPRTVDATNCEFIDGFHPGDVVLARMLKIMAADPAIGLMPLLNRRVINDAVDKYRGHATADLRYRLKGEHELDFLSLGYKKS